MCLTSITHGGHETGLQNSGPKTYLKGGLDGMVWTGFDWLRIGPSGGHL